MDQGSWREGYRDGYADGVHAGMRLEREKTVVKGMGWDSGEFLRHIGGTRSGGLTPEEMDALAAAERLFREKASAEMLGVPLDKCCGTDKPHRHVTDKARAKQKKERGI